MKEKDINFDFDPQKLTESAKVMTDQILKMSNSLKDAMHGISEKDLSKLNVTQKDLENKVYGLNSELKDLQRKIKGL